MASKISVGEGGGGRNSTPVGFPLKKKTLQGFGFCLGFCFCCCCSVCWPYVCVHPPPPRTLRLNIDLEQIRTIVGSFKFPFVFYVQKYFFMVICFKCLYFDQKKKIVKKNSSMRLGGTPKAPQGMKQYGNGWPLGEEESLFFSFLFFFDNNL